MKQTKIDWVDCEPKWVDLVEEFIAHLEHKNYCNRATLNYDGLRQMANCCDRVRQAQKKGRKWLKL